MQIFLDEFAKTLDQEVLLVMDNAGWHSGLSLSKKYKWCIYRHTRLNSILRSDCGNT
jgi:hypothetical protein